MGKRGELNGLLRWFGSGIWVEVIMRLSEGSALDGLPADPSPSILATYGTA